MTVRTTKLAIIAMTPAAQLLSCSKINMGSHKENCTGSLNSDHYNLFWKEYSINEPSEKCYKLNLVYYF